MKSALVVLRSRRLAHLCSFSVITDIVSLLKTSQWKPSALRKRHSFIIATDAEAAALHVPVTASRMSMIPWINVALARRVCPF